MNLNNRYTCNESRLNQPDPIFNLVQLSSFFQDHFFQVVAQITTREQAQPVFFNFGKEKVWKSFLCFLLLPGSSPLWYIWNKPEKLFSGVWKGNREQCHPSYFFVPWPFEFSVVLWMGERKLSVLQSILFKYNLLPVRCSLLVCGNVKESWIIVFIKLK